MILLSTIETGTKAADELIATWAVAADREHVARKKKPGAARNSLLGRALTRRLLGKEFEIEVLENGKPYIKNGPYISVSHSHQIVAAAVCADFPVGVDIEFHAERDLAKLAAYAFGPEENKLVASGGAAEFYRIWTMREAIAKISGETMFKRMDGRDIDLTQWQVFHDSPNVNYSLALAIENKGISLNGMVKKVDVT